MLAFPVGRMARKKRLGFRIEKEVRRRARLGIGPPPGEKVILDKRRKAPKHKKKLIEDEI